MLLGYKLHFGSNLPPIKGQPPKRGQKLCSQIVLYSEVPLYIVFSQRDIFLNLPNDTTVHKI